MEDNKRVYICDVDYIYTEKAEEYKTLAGGAVYVFIKAFDVRDALALLLQDIKAKNIEAREIVSITPYDINQEWASVEEGAHYLALYNECDKDTPVVYDDFLAYSREN